jgi:peptide-methionine (S)-S-oxide reductase
MDGSPSSIVLGGGCFWCLDAAYRLIPGVVGTTCGYAGGKPSNPTYEQICAGTTGHAEVLKIDYDPSKVSLDRLLEIFWQIHDATQVGGQGNDIGTQYRSVIYYATEGERQSVTASRDREQKTLSEPMTTEVLPLPTFWPAEAYHQNYFNQHPERGYCAAVIRPKIRHLQDYLASPKG